MKILKGLTSQGFGLYLKSLTSSEFCKISGAEIPVFSSNKSPKENAFEFIILDAIKLRLRDDWDRYSLKPLKKEMFVNEMEKPVDKLYFENPMKYKMGLSAWEESEKKVIFKDVLIQERTYKKTDVFVQKKYIAQFINKDNWLFNDLTLGDLFNMSDGELELQNVTI